MILNDQTLYKIGSGEFRIGEPYNPIFDDFEQKAEVLNEIKSVIYQRYFSENKNPSDQPVFCGRTKAKEVYLLDFDEGCMKYNQFRILIYTEDGYVYRGVLFYSNLDQMFICQESGTSEVIYYKVSDLENAHNGDLKGIADYFERIKKYSICKITI